MMLSRLAEQLYWHGRYLERSEGLARLINVNAHLNLDLPGSIAPGWEPLIRITGNTALFDEICGAEMSERTIARFLIADDRNPGSILSSLEYARENLRAARDLMPREVWEETNRLYLEMRERFTGNISKRRRHEALNELIRGSQLVAGMLMGTMSHDPAYDFILLGRHLERADMTTRIVDVRADDLLPEDIEELPPFESIQWMSVLKSLTGYQMYRRHVRLRVTGHDVLRFLLRDRMFPRSLMFCLDQIEQLLNLLPGDDDRALRATLALKRRIDQAPVMRLRDARLAEFIDHTQIELGAIGESIAATWFLPMHSD